MSKPSLLVLGGAGMLGWNCLRYLRLQDDIQLWGQVRPGAKDQMDAMLEGITYLHGGMDWLLQSADKQRFDYILNCIGKIKPVINEKDPLSVADAYETNAVLPHRLAAAFPDSKIVSIQTDCVFTGKGAGGYTESSFHDDTTVYGKSKSAGEVQASNYYNVRFSIIGREPVYKRSLVEWVLGHMPGAMINGYTEHLWNGCPAFVLGKLIHGFIQGKVQLKANQHLVPANVLNKHELVSCIAAAYGRVFYVEPKETERCYRTLATNDPAHNEAMWKAAGYPIIPTIQELITEMVTQ